MPFVAFGKTLWSLEVRAHTCAVFDRGNVIQPDHPFQISYLDHNGDNTIRQGSVRTHGWKSADDARQFAVTKQKELLERIAKGEHVNTNVSILANPAVIIQ